MIRKSFMIACAVLFVLCYVSLRTVNCMALRRTAFQQISPRMHRSQVLFKRTGSQVAHRLGNIAQRLNRALNQETSNSQDRTKNIPAVPTPDLFSSTHYSDGFYDLPPVSVAKPSVAYHKEPQFTNSRKAPSNHPEFLAYVNGRIPVKSRTNPEDLLTLDKSRRPISTRKSIITEEDLIHRLGQPTTYPKPEHTLESELKESGSGEAEYMKSAHRETAQNPEVGPSAKTDILILTNVDPTSGLDMYSNDHFGKCGPQDMSYCLHGGTCVMIRGRAIHEKACQCTSSYTGIRCETPDVPELTHATDKLVRDWIEMDRRLNSQSPYVLTSTN